MKQTALDTAEVASAERWILFDRKLAFILPIVIAGICFLSGIINAYVFSETLGTTIAVLIMLGTWSSGAIFALITWVILKIRVSYKTLQLAYLDSINDQLAEANTQLATASQDVHSIKNQIDYLRMQGE